MSTTPTTSPAPTPRPTLSTLFQRFKNAYFAMASDEYREDVSDAALKRRYDAANAAEKELLAEHDALLAENERLKADIEKLKAAVGPGECCPHGVRWDKDCERCQFPS